ncbi:MAG: glycosyltransferase family 2 protein [Candidatus Asgardarchaeum sp.]
MTKKKVSFVISSWNRKEDLKECLKSIRNQTYKNIEIIIVDNHSTDGTIDMIRADFPEVRLIIMPDSTYGACETFNIGFANATGDYIFILDDDSALGDNKVVENAIKIFENRPNLAAICCRIINPITQIEETKNWDKKFGIWADDECVYGNFFHGAGTIVKRKVLEEVGYYDKDYFIFANEGDLALRILNRGYDICFCKNLIVFHKKRNANKVTPRQIFFYTRNNLFTVWKHYPFIMGISTSFRILLKYLGATVISRNPKSYFAFIRAIFSFIHNLKKIFRKRKTINMQVMEVQKKVIYNNFPNPLSLLSLYRKIRKLHQRI